MRGLKISRKIVLLSCVLLTLFAGVNSFGQYEGTPVKLDKLISALKSKQLQTREIVAVIKTNGVDFQVTPDIESALVSSGARPEVIVAAKSNYRAPVVVATPAKGPPNKFSGQPLTKDAIVTLLQNGVPDAQVRQNIGSRGVNFKASVADKAEIKAAGGSVTLVNLVVSSYTSATPQTSTVSNTVAASSSDRYQDLLQKAVLQYDTSRDVNGAISTLQEAVRLDPSQARAYQQLGFAYLYGLKNFTEAEKNMQEAITRGGSAVFRVYHDHGALMTDVCQGSLYIAKDTVHFESDDNIHTFETTDDNIKEAKVSGKFAAMFNARAGAFRITLKNGDANKNYNFAPLTNDLQESKMVIKLIGKN